MFKLAEAIGRLALAGREMTRLAGFTARVTELMAVLDDLNHGKYVRTMVNTGREENRTLMIDEVPGGETHGDSDGTSPVVYYCPPMAKQQRVLGAPPPDPCWDSAPDSGGFAARM